MTFTIFVVTFATVFFVIERLLPRLYQQAFFRDYEVLMVELEEEVLTSLRTWVDAEYQRIGLFMDWFETTCAVDVDSDVTFTLIPSTAQPYVSVGVEGNDFFELPEECERIEIGEMTAFGLGEYHWFEFGIMYQYYETYGTGPFGRIVHILSEFAQNHNVRIVLWEILPPPRGGQLGDILFEVDRRPVGSDSMTMLAGSEIAVRQQNIYSPEVGGFAIALTGNFEPAYRVLSIISRMQQQIFIVLFFLLMPVAYWLATSVSKPVLAVSKASKRLIDLNFKESFESKRLDEIGDLSRNLNHMSFQLRRTIEKLEIANERLTSQMEKERAQEKQRRQLFAAVSHELKTPITILKGEIGGMIDGVGSYKDRDTYLISAYEWTQTLERLVLQILNVTRLEGEKIQLNISTCDVSELIKRGMKHHESLAGTGNVNVAWQLADDLLIQADSEQLTLAISNVISNAIIYTPSESEVVIETKKQEATVLLTVTNHGAMIPEDELEHLFQPFYRLEKSRNRHTGGSGLGLFIVKNILDLHGFSYNIKNGDDCVIFTITMPIE